MRGSSCRLLNTACCVLNIVYENRNQRFWSYWKTIVKNRI